MLALVMMADLNAQTAAVDPPPEQPAWGAGQSSAPDTATDVLPPGTVSPALSSEASVPTPMAAPAPEAATAIETPADTVGVPREGNFFLPDFDSYGKPIFERQGLKFRVGPVNLRMSLSAGIESNNNIFGSSTNRVSDNILHIIPSLLVGMGDFHAKAEDFFALIYRPSFDYYQTQTQQNRVSQGLTMSGRATFSRYSTEADLNYSTSSQPNATQTGGQQYSLFNFNWDNTYYLGAKVFAGASINASAQTSENSNANSQTFSFAPRLGYTYSPKTTVFVAPFAGISYVGNGSSQTFQGLNVGFTYTTLRKLTINGAFGAQSRQFDGLDTSGASNFITPVYNFGIVWAARQTTNLELSFVQDVGISDIQQGLTYTGSTVTLGVTQQILQKVTLNLGLSYQNLDYQGNSTLGRTDQYVSFTPSLSYSFGHDAWAASIYFRYQQRNSTLANDNYDVNAYGFQLTYNF